MSRIKNARRNIIWIIINKIINIILPFFTRTAFIYILGVKYLGLNGLFSSILGLLSIAELGISSAITFSMYKPFAEENYEKISTYLNLYRKLYRIIGIIILCLGLLIIPFLRKFISGDIPQNINIYVLYCIYLLNTVIGYLMFAYKSSLLVASQKNDVNVKINTIFLFVTNIVQLIIIFLSKNYYCYVIVIPIMTLLNNLVINTITNKMFPQIKCSGIVPDKERNSIIIKVKGLLWQKIGIAVSNSVDNIVISAFLGLNMIAIYGNYYYIMSAISSIFAVIIDALAPIVGNCLVSKTKEENYHNFKLHNFVYMWMIIWGTTCFLCLYQPTIKLWLRDDSMLLPFSSVILLSLYFFSFRMSNVSGLYKQAAGLWWEGKYVPIIAAIVNLVTNIILVNIIGLNGIILSTILSMVLVYFPYGSYILFKHLFNYKGAWINYVIEQIIYFIECVFICVLTYLLCIQFTGNNFTALVIRIVICILVPNIIFLLLNIKNKFIKESFELLKAMI